MKLKEIDRTAMQAWSPAQNHPIYLATGKFKREDSVISLIPCLLSSLVQGSSSLKGFSFSSWIPPSSLTLSGGLPVFTVHTSYVHSICPSTQESDLFLAQQKLEQ